MMLGFLLARAGVKVVVLEKHGDFLRDFRGDTVHPSTLDGDARARPARRVPEAAAPQALALRRLVRRQDGGDRRPHASAGARALHRHDAAMGLPRFPREPRQGALPGFTLLMHAEATELIEEGGRVVGVRATVDGEAEEIRADLVVGADGRHSTVREATGPQGARHRRADGRAVVPAQPQAGRSGRGDGPLRCRQHPGDARPRRLLAVRLSSSPRARRSACGPPASTKLRATIGRLVPSFADRLQRAARRCDDLKLLTVGVDRLEKWWKPGVLCIGDAAHTMSPVGGVGINIAIQDAVAAANILAAPLREGRLTRLRPRRRAGAAIVPGACDPGDAGLPAEPHHRAVARRRRGRSRCRSSCG